MTEPRTPGTWYAHELTTQDNRPVWHSEVRVDVGSAVYQTVALCRSLVYQRQDAEYIAMAVNAHTPLVEALEALLNSYDWSDGGPCGAAPDDCPVCAAVETARAALALARGEGLVSLPQLIGPRLDPLDTPLRDQQLAALNAALTAEVLRHAETRQALLDSLTWVWVKEQLVPVEIIREVPVVVRRVVEIVVPRPPKKGGNWQAGHVRPPVRFPLDLAERTGLATVIQTPLTLRSGAILDPVRVAVRRGKRAVEFPDSSWLILCAMAQRPGEFVGRVDLEAAIYGATGPSSVRSALHRARLTLERVGARDDLESIRISRSGAWRLMVAES